MPVEFKEETKIACGEDFVFFLKIHNGTFTYNNLKYSPPASFFLNLLHE